MGTFQYFEDNRSSEVTMTGQMTPADMYKHDFGVVLWHSIV